MMMMMMMMMMCRPYKQRNFVPFLVIYLLPLTHFLSYVPLLMYSLQGNLPGNLPVSPQDNQLVNPHDNQLVNQPGEQNMSPLYTNSLTLIPFYHYVCSLIDVPYLTSIVSNLTFRIAYTFLDNLRHVPLRSPQDNLRDRCVAFYSFCHSIVLSSYRR